MHQALSACLSHGGGTLGDVIIHGYICEIIGKWGGRGRTDITADLLERFCLRYGLGCLIEYYWWMMKSHPV